MRLDEARAHADLSSPELLLKCIQFLSVLLRLLLLGSVLRLVKPLHLAYSFTAWNLANTI